MCVCVSIDVYVFIYLFIYLLHSYMHAYMVIDARIPYMMPDEGLVEKEES